MADKVDLGSLEFHVVLRGIEDAERRLRGLGSMTGSGGGGVNPVGGVISPVAASATMPPPPMKPGGGLMNLGGFAAGGMAAPAFGQPAGMLGPGGMGPAFQPPAVFAQMQSGAIGAMNAQSAQIRANAFRPGNPMGMLNRVANQNVMSTGMFMNLLFGGWEVATAFNAQAQADRFAKMNFSDLEGQAKAQSMALDRITQGPIGSMVGLLSGASRVRDRIDLTLGGATAGDQRTAAMKSGGALDRQLRSENELASASTTLAQARIKAAALLEKATDEAKAQRELDINAAGAIRNVARGEAETAREDELRAARKRYLLNAMVGGKQFDLAAEEAAIAKTYDTATGIADTAYFQSRGTAERTFQSRVGMATRTSRLQYAAEDFAFRVAQADTLQGREGPARAFRSIIGSGFESFDVGQQLLLDQGQALVDSAMRDPNKNMADALSGAGLLRLQHDANAAQRQYAAGTMDLTTDYSRTAFDKGQFSVEGMRANVFAQFGYNGQGGFRGISASEPLYDSTMNAMVEALRQGEITVGEKRDKTLGDLRDAERKLLIGGDAIASMTPFGVNYGGGTAGQGEVVRLLTEIREAILEVSRQQ